MLAPTRGTAWGGGMKQIDVDAVGGPCDGRCPARLKAALSHL